MEQGHQHRNKAQHRRRRTWGPVIRAADFPDGQSASDPSMITDTATATVWLFYNFMDHDTAPGSYRFHVMSSRDNGATWSEPTDITSQVAPDGWENDFKFLTSGQGTVTRDGRLLHTMVNLDKGLHIIESNDHGISWHLLPAAITPADESKILELPDGRWMFPAESQGRLPPHPYLRRQGPHLGRRSAAPASRPRMQRCDCILPVLQHIRPCGMPAFRQCRKSGRAGGPYPSLQPGPGPNLERRADSTRRRLWLFRHHDSAFRAHRRIFRA